ncbi:MAG: hypothetical protein M0017_04815 [Desulfobacteraceae bacterium]|nr:hypothetical protein [Desulfobacteraceae bacterium]
MGVAKYAHLYRLLRNERRPLEELRELQLRRLQRLVAHAYQEVPYYRRSWERLGFHPGDLRSLDDLQKLPVIDKAAFQQHPEELLAGSFRGQPLTAVRTSGSSGKPLRFWVSPPCNQFRDAQFLRPYLSNGRRLLDKGVWFKVNPLPPPKWFQRIGMLREQTIYPGVDLREQAAAFRRLAPDVLMGHASSAARLASHLQEEGAPFKRPRMVFTDSELLTPQMRRSIREAFGCEPLDVYGTYETENIAYECDHHQGYHIALDAVIMEFIRDGRPAGPGEEGEIVCTVLTNFTMPFIRYNLHDLGSYRTGPCTCGRTFPLMKMIGGRADDYLIHPEGGRKSPWDLWGHLLPLAEYLHEYQVVQQEIHLFQVQVVPSRQFHEGIKQAVADKIRLVFPAARVEVLVTDRIDREPSGKFRAFKTLVRIEEASASRKAGISLPPAPAQGIGVPDREIQGQGLGPEAARPFFQPSGT